MELCDKLYRTIEGLIINEKICKFYVGTSGAFDHCVYVVLKQLREKYNIEIIVVLAYLNEKENMKYSPTETVFPSVLEKTPPKFAIIKRNIYMIERSQYMVCYLNYTFSNSYTFVKKAVAKKLNVINIGDFNIKTI